MSYFVPVLGECRPISLFALSQVIFFCTGYWSYCIDYFTHFHSVKIKEMKRVSRWKNFSERELTFTFAICCRPSVCLSVCRLSSVRLVHPTQPVEILGNFSTPFDTLAIHWHPRKISRRSSQENPSVGGFKYKRGVAKYSDFGHTCIEGYISETVQYIGGKFVLITNRKSYMSFRLVPKSVTLNDLQRRNGSYFALFHRIP